MFQRRSARERAECSLLKDGDTIQIAVSGTNATFAFNSVDPNRNPVATIQGNTINSGSKSFDVNDNDPSLPPAQQVNCVETITETTSGSLVANDQDQGALVYSSVAKSGTQCTAASLNYKAYPCSSTLSFMEEAIAGRPVPVPQRSQSLLKATLA